MTNHKPQPAEHPADEQVEGSVKQPDQSVLEQLDAEEAEFRAIRRDLPGVKGASAAGIVAISVGKTPTKNEFFRTHYGVSSDRADSRVRSEYGEAILCRHRRNGRALERNRYHRQRLHLVSHHHVAG